MGRHPANSHHPAVIAEPRPPWGHKISCVVKYMRKYLFNKKALIFLGIFLVAGYLAYDHYFTLPFSRQQPVTEETPVKPEFTKFNVLLLGLDGRQGVNSRADTIIVASLDGSNNQARLLSIPRDTRVKIKGGWDKINAAYAYGGVELTRDTVSDFLGVPIDRYAVIDFVSLVKMVDAVGGIEVDVPVRMYVPLEGIDLKPGKQHLTGEQVLAYSRFRGTIEGDIDRARRQQEVVQILLQEALKAENLPRLAELVEIVKENVETDLSAKEMISLARIAPAVMDKGLSAQVLPGRNKKIDGIWYWEPDLATLDSLLDTAGNRQVAVLEDSSQKL